MQYDWIDFYTEFATKLLPFKTDRKTLIQKIYAVYDAAGISVPKLESGDVIIDVDPFTIFGTFNKGITNANRIAILNGIASEFGIATHVPSIFDGIPVLNNLKATFYGFKDDTTAISMIQSIINDHKREKREQGNDKRDLEYHEKRMKDSK